MVAANRADTFKELSDAYYGYNRPGAQVSQAAKTTGGDRMGGIKAPYDCIRPFYETDFTEDLKKMRVPTLVMAGDDDQCVPQPHALAAARLLPHSTLKSYPGLVHGMPMTHADQINHDLLEIIHAKHLHGSASSSR